MTEDYAQNGEGCHEGEKHKKSPVQCRGELLCFSLVLYRGLFAALSPVLCLSRWKINNHGFFFSVPGDPLIFITIICQGRTIIKPGKTFPITPVN